MAPPKLVYTTGPEKPEPTTKAKGYQKAAGPAKMRLETKGRGGKAVTVLFNLPFTETEARALMKTLQAALGCGATLKESAIEFQGERRAAISAYFAKQGWKLVPAGG